MRYIGQNILSLKFYGTCLALIWLAIFPSVRLLLSLCLLRYRLFELFASVSVPCSVGHQQQVLLVGSGQVSPSSPPHPLPPMIPIHPTLTNPAPHERNKAWLLVCSLGESWSDPSFPSNATAKSLLLGSCTASQL